METTTFNVPSISCNVCSDKITNGIKTLNGISEVAVDLKTKMVKVDFNPEEIKPQDIRKKVASLGYEIAQ
jgi:copper chaperone